MRLKNGGAVDLRKERFRLDRFGRNEPGVKIHLNDLREPEGCVRRGANVAFAHELDVLQEARMIIDWACGPMDSTEVTESEGLDGEMVQEQEQEQEVREYVRVCLLVGRHSS